MGKRCVVTGGSGFIGACLSQALVRQGWNVICVDNMMRGDRSRFAEFAKYIDFRSIDVRDVDAITETCRGAEVAFHLAAVNGTENFYKCPELVLDVGIKGMLSVVEACKKANVPDLVVASSAEVYQTPQTFPTDETVPLMLPNSLNPRYSYGGSKIISELIAFNYGRKHFRKVQVFRPHNVYGPNMGWKHVIPQLILRALDAKDKGSRYLEIQGNGIERRAFAYVEDVVDGVLAMYKGGQHREIYHIGNDYEISIRDLVELIAHVMRSEFEIVQGKAAPGGTSRRCPDLSKMREIGYVPKIALEEGLERTVDWYVANHNHDRKLKSVLM